MTNEKRRTRQDAMRSSRLLRRIESAPIGSAAAEKALDAILAMAKQNPQVIGVIGQNISQKKALAGKLDRMSASNLDLRQFLIKATGLKAFNIEVEWEGATLDS